MVSQADEMDGCCVSPGRGMQSRLVKANLILSFLIGLLLLSLHQPSGNGKAVPDMMMFQVYPSVFEAFVISVIFSFAGSFGWLFVGNKPKLATFRKCYFIISMLFLGSALSILVCALFLANFRPVARGSGLWPPGWFSAIDGSIEKIP